MTEAGNWTCPRCGVEFRFRNGARSTRDRSICAEPRCGVRFWHGGTPWKIRMYVDPDDCPSGATVAEVKDPAILAAIREPLDRYLAERRGQRAA